VYCTSFVCQKSKVSKADIFIHKWLEIMHQSSRFTKCVSSLLVGKLKSILLTQVILSGSVFAARVVSGRSRQAASTPFALFRESVGGAEFIITDEVTRSIKHQNPFKKMPQ